MRRDIDSIHRPHLPCGHLVPSDANDFFAGRTTQDIARGYHSSDFQPFSISVHQHQSAVVKVGGLKHLTRDLPPQRGKGEVFAPFAFFRG
jgi:hypothetical protein